MNSPADRLSKECACEELIRPAWQAARRSVKPCLAPACPRMVHLSACCRHSIDIQHIRTEQKPPSSVGGSSAHPPQALQHPHSLLPPQPVLPLPAREAHQSPCCWALSLPRWRWWVQPLPAAAAARPPVQPCTGAAAACQEIATALIQRRAPCQHAATHAVWSASLRAALWGIPAPVAAQPPLLPLEPGVDQREVAAAFCPANQRGATHSRPSMLESLARMILCWRPPAGYVHTWGRGPQQGAVASSIRNASHAAHLRASAASPSQRSAAPPTRLQVPCNSRVRTRLVSNGEQPAVLCQLPRALPCSRRPLRWHTLTAGTPPDR